MAQVSERYARALFRVSEENDSLERDLEQVIFVRDRLDKDDVQAYLNHPGIKKRQKEAFFQEAFPEIAPQLLDFLFLMLQKRRENIIVSALSDYIELVNRHFDRIKARVVSARGLDVEQISSLEVLLSQHLDLEVSLVSEIDPEVIAGFYVLVEGHIFDGTVRTQLNEMKKRLKRGNL